MNSETIGARLRRLRKQKEYSQEELSQKAGCNQGALSNYERGKRTPNMEATIAIANALEVSIDYLLMGETFLFRETADTTYSISDDGMAPEIRKGDQVTISSEAPAERELALIEIEERKFIVRRIQYLSSKEINLIAGNSSYPPIHGLKNKLKIKGSLRSLYRTY